MKTKQILEVFDKKYEESTILGVEGAREEIQKALDEQKLEIIEMIKEMPNTFPEMESDEFDEGFGTAKYDIIKRIKKL